MTFLVHSKPLAFELCGSIMLTVLKGEYYDDGERSPRLGFLTEEGAICSIDQQIQAITELTKPSIRCLFKHTLILRKVSTFKVQHWLCVVFSKHVLPSANRIGFD